MRDIDGNGHVPSNDEANPKQTESTLLTDDGNEPSVCECCLEDDPIYQLGYQRAMTDMLAKVVQVLTEARQAV